MARRDKGEGTLFKRKDGRWCARINVTLPNGEVKRAVIVKKDRAKAKAQLEEWKERNKKKLPFVEENWTVESYAKRWLEDIMPGKVRLSTLLRYRDTVRLYIVPGIGKIPLKELGVHHVQKAVDTLVKNGVSANGTLKFRRVLSACLMRAMREEVIFRNVAQLIEIPKYSPKKIFPWTAEQAKLFLRETKGHHFHIAYAMMLTYGFRKGEMLGLRWTDIDFANDIICIRQQVNYLVGTIRANEVKTEAGRRTLPLIPEIKQELLELAAQKNLKLPSFDPWKNLCLDGLILMTSNNTPIDPNNFARVFRRHIDEIGLPRVSVHTMRHTAATLQKNMGVPVKEAQLILGHANISTTLGIYQHGDMETQRMALGTIGAALSCS